MGFLYLISDPSTEAYKIGITSAKDVKRRKKQLQTGNAEELFVQSVYESKNYKKIEQMFHNHYSHRHVSGEWFNLTIEEVGRFQKQCVKFDVIIESLKDNKFFKNKT